MPAPFPPQEIIPPDAKRVGRLENVVANNKNFFFKDELFSGRVGTAADASDLHREYVRRFLVGVKSKDVSSYAVCRCPGLPLLGSFYVHPNGIEYDQFAVAYRKRAEPQNADDWTYWVVTVEYSTQAPDGGFILNQRVADLAQKDPSLLPVSHSFSSQVLNEAPLADLTGRPFWNSAQQPFQPAPTVETPVTVMRINRNFLDWGIDLQEIYSFTLNDKMFMGRPRGTVMSMPPTATEKHLGPLRYYAMQFEFRFRRLECVPVASIGPAVPGCPQNTTTTATTTTTPGDSFKTLPLSIFDNAEVIIFDPFLLNKQTGKIETTFGCPPGSRYATWQPRILDAGLMERVPNPNFVGPVQPGQTTGSFVLKEMVGSSGRPVSYPIPLDGKGRRQFYVDEFCRPVPVYLEFEYYRYLDFNRVLQEG